MSNTDIKGSRLNSSDLRSFRRFSKLHIHKRKSASDPVEKAGEDMEACGRNKTEPDRSCLAALRM